MRFRFQYRRYRLPFRAVVRTAHGPWREREGVLVRLEDAAENGSGAVGWGEAAPIPWFGTETADEVDAGCRAIGEWIEDAALDDVPAKLACLRHALSAARNEVLLLRARTTRDNQAAPASSSRVASSLDPSTINSSRAASSRAASSGGGSTSSAASSTAPAGTAASAPTPPTTLGVAALLPAGVAALPLISPRADIGFRVFKWKVGVGDLADELALLDDVCAALPSGGSLRLDANGAWDRKQAERWLERCADRPVEFVEQPCFTPANEGATAQRRTEERLLGLASDYPTPVALDESLVGDGDVERWVGAGWPGIFVLKPSLLGDVHGAIGRLKKAEARVVFSSALETAVGARAALRVAFSWNPPSAAAHTAPPRALGFGVWPLFADARFDGPFAAPYLRLADVERIDPGLAWNALP